MNARLVERQLALAAVALVATLGSLALDGEGPADPRARVQPAPAPGSDWYEASVATSGPRYGRVTACGITLTRRTRGITHPLLPCGARIVVAHRGREVETRVIDRGPFGKAYDFTLTPALASELAVTRVDAVRWRFSTGKR